MPDSFRAFRDVIIRTARFDEAVRFYESVLGLKKFLGGESLAGFETGAFRLFVERGHRTKQQALNRRPLNASRAALP